MGKEHYIISKIKNVSLKDITGFLRFSAVLPIAGLYYMYQKILHKKHWLISEDEYGANDNGYVFLKYLLSNHREISVFYAISEKSQYCERIKRTGKYIKWGGLKHWVMYLTADAVITTQMGASPCTHVTLPLEIMGILKNKRIFLQHGILLNYYRSLDYSNNKLALFICGAKPEYQYIAANFHFPDKHVVYTGLARFDELHHCKTDSNLILLMPTWRYWFRNRKAGQEGTVCFRKSEYYKKFNSLIHNARLLEFLEKQNLTMLFYPHREMQKYLGSFYSDSKNLKIQGRFEEDIQEILKKGAFLITDYSSVSMDFAYMKKPVLYYQFDKEKFRKQHGGYGYFSYDEDGFGPVVAEENGVIDFLIKSYENGFQMSPRYADKADAFFELHDSQNCKRIFQAIADI